jgi:L-seryl-tRNA(Ser) seleniumtransferase
LDQTTAAGLDQSESQHRHQNYGDNRVQGTDPGRNLDQHKELYDEDHEHREPDHREHGLPFYRRQGLARLPDVSLGAVSDTTNRPPSVDQLARSLVDSGLPHPLRVEVARDAIAQINAAQTDRTGASARELAAELATQRSRRMLTPVINGTGVLLHTNLGRAPLDHHQEASYGNLELSLADGKRGSRQQAVGELLATATGAEAAMVVNNCAGAVLLALAALATGRGVAVSRGELVEIGGGFRVPDVMRQSGAELVEVGTTNRTRRADFQRAETEHDLALVMHIHQSNYRIVGFTESASIASLATLATPLVADIGSGLLDAACPWLDGPPPSWLQDEPAARQTLEAGADLVLFSGDKLLGGPQAGIIAGRADMVAACSKHPLARALRPGGLVLSALQRTTLAYLERDGDAIPFWRMVARSIDELRTRANTLAASTGATVVETEALPGGGTLPGVSFPSIGVQVAGDHVDHLRTNDPPIIGRVTDNGKATILDLRTIEPADDPLVGAALQGRTA